ncbi:MAG: tandem-95 repeat protein, partial [Chloroflexi bacterium]|nr:tandem-95 repeat protein [Chloroflexota bacterium]
GDGATGVHADSITLTAKDSSSILSGVGATSMAASVAGGAGVSVAIGVSTAFNEVSNVVAAFILNADDVTTETGNVTLSSTTEERKLFDMDLAAASFTLAELDDAATADEDNPDKPGDDSDDPDDPTDDGPGYNEAENDAAGDADILSRLKADIESNYEVALEGDLRLSILSEGESWALSTEPWITYIISYDHVMGKIKVSRATITATSVAASVSAGFAVGASIRVSGAGVFALNTVLTKTNTYIKNSNVNDAVDVSLSALSSSGIMAVTGAFSASIGVGLGGAAGVSLGAAVSVNTIGYTWYGVPSASEVRAYIENSSIKAEGALTQMATAKQTIGSIVFAGSAAIAGGAGAGIAASGSGVTVINRINVDVEASITGDGASGIEARSITLTARDLSVISTVAGATSLAASVAGAVGVSISLGASVAFNQITNSVESFISGADDYVKTSTGAIGLLADGSATIKAVASAASMSAGFAVGGSVRISGAGADATNLILTNTNSYIEDSTIDSKGAVNLETQSNSKIKALIISASFSASIGLAAGIGASLGVSLAHNWIGYKLNGDRDPNKVQAYLKNTNLDAVGNITQAAIAEQTIEALVIAGSAAISGGIAGVAVSGSGVIVENKIATLVKSYIEGTGTETINAAQVMLTADDNSTITATAGAASVAASFGLGGGSVSIGVSAARNVISNEVDVSIQNVLVGSEAEPTGTIKLEAINEATISAISSAASLSAGFSIGGTRISGAGAGATNIILSKTAAHIDGSTVHSSGDVDLDATDTSTITAKIITASASVAVGGVAYGASIGVSVARNYIGMDPYGSDIPTTYTTADSAQTLTPTPIITVKHDGGVRGGEVYQYVGEAKTLYNFETESGSQTINEDHLVKLADNYDENLGVPGGIYKARDDHGYTQLGTEDYTDEDNWEYVGPSGLWAQEYGDSDTWMQTNFVDDPVQVAAYVSSSSIHAAGALTLDAKADETIEAIVVAGSVAIAGAGGVGVGGSGAGVNSGNKITTEVRAYIQGSGASGIEVGSAKLTAQDTSTITATTNSAAVAGSFAGTGAVAASVSVAIASNEISNIIEAYIKDAASVVATEGSIELNALENATIDAGAVAASLSAAFSAGLGIALSGSGADATNFIANTVKAYIDNSTVETRQLHDYTTGQQVPTLNPGDRVLLLSDVGGGTSGEIYEYTGGSATNTNLGAQTYTDPEWDLIGQSANYDQDILVNAQSTSSIVAVVGAAAVGAGWGTVAAAGAMGYSKATNLIGVDPADHTSTLLNQVLAYVVNSNLQSAGDILITASSTDRLDALSFAGSVAIAVGLGGALAGSGTEITNLISSQVHAYMADTTATAVGDIKVQATSDSQVIKANSLGVAVAVSLGAASVAGSEAVNTIANEIQARISSTASKTISAGGNLEVSAKAIESKIGGVEATASGVSGGLVALSGVGIGIYNTVANTILTEVRGPVHLSADGDLNVLSSENAWLSGDAATLSIAVGLGGAVGVAKVYNTIGGTVTTQVLGDSNTDTTLTAANVLISAAATATIFTTNTAGIAASLVGVQENISQAAISTVVKTDVSQVGITATGAVEVNSTGTFTANTLSKGASGGVAAIGGMNAVVFLGNGTSVYEVETILGNSTKVDASTLSVSAVSTDNMTAQSNALGVAFVLSVAGAYSTVYSDLASLAQIGDNTEITVGGFILQSRHVQIVQSHADALSVGLATGNGSNVDNYILSKANVIVGENNTVTADTILIDAINIAQTFSSLKSFSASALSVADLVSSTDIGTGSNHDNALFRNNPFEAVVSIGSGTTMTVEGSHANPGVIDIAAYTNVEGYDVVTLEAVSGFGVSLAESRILAPTKTQVLIDGATLENKVGDIYLTTRSDAQITPSTNMLVVAGISAVAKADVTGVTFTDNLVEVKDSTIKGSDVHLVSGRDSWGVPNLLFVSSNSEITAASLVPNIVIPVVKAQLFENNVVRVLGNSQVLALEDVNILAVEGAKPDVPPGEEEIKRASTDGLALSLSLVPYGMEVPDGAVDSSNYVVDLEPDAVIKGGINNKTIVLINPVKVGDADDAAIMNRILSADPNDDFLTAAEKIALGLSENIEYHYVSLNVENIKFTVTTGTIIHHGGQYYKFLPVALGSVQIDLMTENYANGSRWGTPTQAEIDNGTVYESDVTEVFSTNLENKFYVVKPVELDSPTLNYLNVGNLLLDQRNQVLNWMDSHNGNDEAIARYEVQLQLLDEAIAELGFSEIMVQVDTGDVVLNVDDNKRYRYLGAEVGIVLATEDYSNGSLWAEVSSATPYDHASDTTKGVTLFKESLDMLLVETPNIYAAPGSIYIEAFPNDPVQAVALQIEILLKVALKQIVASPGAEIRISNETPFSLVVNDAIIRDNKRIEIIDGEYTVLQPGNVYFNYTNLTSITDNSDSVISITQQSFGPGIYDFGGLEQSVIDQIFLLDQDMYLSGDIVNQAGALNVNNVEGSVIVSGELRAETITIQAGKDFTLNSDAWFHTNQDPRQYTNYDTYRSEAYYGGHGNLLYSNPVIETTLPPAFAAGLYRDEAMIVAQGRISVTAQYLNINGLVQSGLDTMELIVDSSFNPGNKTVSFLDDDGNPRQGISFGSGLVQAPLDGYFDAAQQAIVVEDIEPTGGTVILAGRIMSTGNGRIKVANGYTNLNIDNQTDYKLILNNVDMTTKREGKIIIIDTGRDPIQKKIYTLYVDPGTGTEYIREETLNGTLVSDPVENDGVVSKIEYTPDPANPTTDHNWGTVLQYATRPNLHYVWTEGQEKTEVVVTKYEKKSFNLFGDNWFADLLVNDDSWVSQDTTYRDTKPLLESEAMGVEGDSNVPWYANGMAYTIYYEEREDASVEVIQNTTVIKDDSDPNNIKYYRRTGANDDLELATIDYANDSDWTNISYSGDCSGDPNCYNYTYKNYTYEYRTWTTGGGWLRKKTIHTKITTTSGLKDYYTHTLKADYPIEIYFMDGPDNSTLDIESDGDIFLQGNVEVPIHSSINLTSNNGSVTGADNVAIYGANPQISAKGDVQINTEGNVPTNPEYLDIEADGDIRVVLISESNAESSIVVERVVSKFGNVTLHAPDGITAADGNSVVAGNRIELHTSRGSIGTLSQPLRVDSSYSALGGVAAKAEGGIYLQETDGDMYLIRPATWENPQASIESTSDAVVNIAVDNGSLYDGVYELFNPGAENDDSSINPALQARFDDGTFSLNAFKYPLSPGLYSYLYPHGELLGTVPDVSAPELPNIKGGTIEITVSDEIGRVSEMTTINDPVNFDALTQTQMEIMAYAKKSDVVGVNYELYRYTGGGASGVTFDANTFSGGVWSKVNVDFATGTNRGAANNVNVATSQVVLVQFTANEYGMYQYRGAGGTINLSNQDYRDTSLWQELDGAAADHATDDSGPVTLVNGDVVINKYMIESLTIQLWDDIDIKSTGTTAIDAGDGVSVESEDSFSIHHVYAGGLVRIVAGGNILGFDTVTPIADFSSGELILISQGGSVGQQADPLLLDMLDGARVSAYAPNSVFIKELYGNYHFGMNIDTIDAPIVVELHGEHFIHDAYESDRPNVFTEVLNIFTTTNTSITAVGESNNFLDIDLVSTTGRVNAETGGSIFLAETEGDLLVEQIFSFMGDVSLKAFEASIFEWNGDAPADVQGNSITLDALNGAIGKDSDYLDIDSSYQQNGTVSTSSAENTYLTETSGDLRLGHIQVTGAGRFAYLEMGVGNISAILDGNNAAMNITAPSARLIAPGGIGDSATSSPNSIETSVDNLEAYAVAGNIFVVNHGHLHLGGVTAGAATGMNASGSIDVVASSPLTVIANIIAAGAINLRAYDNGAADVLTINPGVVVESTGSGVTLQGGDAVMLTAGSIVNAAGNVTIRIDCTDTETNPNCVNGDADGGRLDLLGQIYAPGITIIGDSDDDVVYIAPQIALVHTTVTTGDGKDTIILHELKPTDIISDTVDLNGQGGSDLYIIDLAGNSQYLINIEDSGANDDGVDKVIVNGTDENDTFLLRSRVWPDKYDPADEPDSLPAFVALLTNDGTTVERINYDQHINGRLRVNGFGGDDGFFVDDNASITTLDGGEGSDYFQFGQIFKSARVAHDDPDTPPDFSTGIAHDDVFATIETTRGFLSNGVSNPLTAMGGDGEDVFQVYHNLAVLRLEGNDDDDTFIVRAFVVLDELAKQAMTYINSGKGYDKINYVINAPVSIDGGDGEDTVVIIGTEFHDNFVVTKDGVYGAGLNVSYENVEKVALDGMEGDDNFYVLSTSDEWTAVLIGNRGSDTFNIAGDVDVDIISNDLLGISGTIHHTITTQDPDYRLTFIEDVVIRAMTNEKSSVVVEESDAVTQIDEMIGGGTSDTYKVKLTDEPEDTVYLNISAPTSQTEEAADGGKTIEISANGSPFDFAVVLVFTKDNYSTFQEVTVRALDDTYVEGDRFIEVSHAIISEDEEYDELAIANVRVRVRDNDRNGLVIDQSEFETEVVETGATDTYEVMLTHAPTADVTVNLKFDNLQMELQDHNGVVIDSLTFTPDESAPGTCVLGDWNCPQLITVIALEDGLSEGKHTYTIEHELDSSDGEFNDLIEELDVTLYDKASVKITESNGNTYVIAGASDDSRFDDYTVVLTTAPALNAVVEVYVNDTDIDGNLVNTSTEIVSQTESYGTATVDPATGNILYNPTTVPTDGGDETITYRICDSGDDGVAGNGDDACDEAEVSIRFNPALDNPVAQVDTITTTEDTAVNIPVLQNDILKGTNTVIDFLRTTEPKSGQIALGADSISLDYTPDPDSNGSDFFSYMICNDEGACAMADVTIEVTPVNDLPETRKDLIITRHDQDITFIVTTNDFDIDDLDDINADSVTKASDPTNGTVDFSLGNGQIKYTPNPGYYGEDTFAYNVCDFNSGCSTGTVIVHVNGDPIATDDSGLSTNEDTAFVISIQNDVLNNDTTPGGGTLTFEGFASPAHGTLTDLGNGNLEYNPHTNFHGSDNFVYRMCNAGGLCDTAQVTITVNSVNDDPVAQDDLGVTTENSSVIIDVAGNDIDVDLNLDVTSVAIDTIPVHGTTTINATTGAITFTPTPSAGYTGFDFLIYDICDTDGECVTARVDLIIVSTLIAAVDDTPPALVEDTSPAIVIPVLANDPGSGSPKIEMISQPKYGDAAILTGETTVSYMPDADYHGSDNFFYIMCTSPTVCGVAQVNLTVNPVNDTPILKDDLAVTRADGSVSFFVHENDLDTDPDNSIDLSSLSISDSPDHGTVIIETGQVVKYTPTPDSDYYGLDTFEYQLCDSAATPACDTASVSVYINADPVADVDTAITDEDTPVDILVLNNDSTPGSGSLEIKHVSQPENGLVEISIDKQKVTYDPADDFNGSDTFTYMMCNTGDVCQVGRVDVTVSPLNDGPVAVNDPVIIDSTVIIDIATSDPSLAVTPSRLIFNASNWDVPQEITVEGVSVPVTDPDVMHFSASDHKLDSIEGSIEIFGGITGDDRSLAGVVMLPGETNVYVPTGEVNGITDTSVEYTSADFNDDLNKYADKGIMYVAILDADNNELEVRKVAGYLLDQIMNYNPNAGSGVDSFIYEICDDGQDGVANNGDDGCGTATVYVAVNNSGEQAAAQDDLIPIDEDISPTETSVDIMVLDNDTDAASIVQISEPILGTAVIDPTNQFITYTPFANANGEDIFEYMMVDGSGIYAVAQVTVMITAVNDAPIARDDLVVTTGTEAVDIAVSVNDEDVEGKLDVNSITILTNPLNGVLNQPTDDGLITYTPSAVGQDSFTYRICDTIGGLDGCAMGTVSIFVNDDTANNPDAVDDLITIDEDVSPTETSVDIMVLDNDTYFGPVGSFTITDVTLPEFGSASIDPVDGLFITYTPDPDAHGLDRFTYRICDDPTAPITCDIAEVQVTINPLNDAPTPRTVLAVTTTDAAVDLDIPSNLIDLEANLVFESLRVDTAPTLGDVSLVAGSTDNVILLTNGQWEQRNPNGTLNTSYYVGKKFVAFFASPTLFVNEAEQTDTLNVWNDGSNLGDTGHMTDTALTGLNMGGGGNTGDDPNDPNDAIEPAISYVGLETFNIYLGNGIDTFHIHATPEGTLTYVQANGENDIINVNSISGDLQVDAGAGNDTINVKIQLPVDVEAASTASVTLNGEEGDDIFNIKENGVPISLYITMDGGADNDTWVFEGAWGQIDNISDPSGNDELNFSLLTHDIRANIFDDLVSVSIGDIDAFSTYARDDLGITPINTALGIEVLANDIDVDGNLDPATVTITTPPDPTKGAAVWDPFSGTIIFTPVAGFTGSDSFEYQVCDRNGHCDTAMVYVAVNATDINPIPTDDSFTTVEDASLNFDVIANDSVPTWTVDSYSQPQHGSLEFDPASGEFTYNADMDFYGDDGFAYRVCTAPDSCGLAHVEIDVTLVDDLPIANSLVHQGNTIERLIGGQGNDSFHFADGDALASGDTGSSYIDAHDGAADLLYYLDFSSANPVTVNLKLNQATGVDYVTNIENVTGGDGDDSLTGDDGSNVLRGSFGNDTLIGLLGDDFYMFLDDWGQDQVIENPADPINPGGGNDTINFYAYSGDTITFEPAPVSVDLDFVLDNAALWDTVADVAAPATNTLRYTSQQIEYAFGGLGIDTLYTLDQNSNFDIDGVTVDTDPLFSPDEAPIMVAATDRNTYSELGDDFTFDSATEYQLEFANFERIQAGELQDVFHMIEDTQRYNLFGGAGDDTFTFEQGATIADLDVDPHPDFQSSINGQGGSDTINFAPYTDVVEIDLSLGKANHIAAGALGRLIDLDNIIGGSNDDILIGDSGDNGITGNAGNDTMTGDLGNDCFYFGNGWGEDIVEEQLNEGDDSFDFTAVTVGGSSALEFNFGFDGLGNPQVVVSDVNANLVTHIGDSPNTSSNIENFIGGPTPDSFVFANMASIAGSIDGGTGSDTLDYSGYTTARDVQLIGLGSQDGYLGTEMSYVDGIIVIQPHPTIGLQFDNVDFIIGSAAALDSLSGMDADATFTINAVDNTYHVDAASALLHTFTFSNFEYVHGGGLVDTFEFRAQNVQVKEFLGGAGNDIFTLFDTVVLKGKINGQGGDDELNYSNYTASGVEVNLAAGIATAIFDALAGGLSSIERVVGSALADTLIGDEWANFIDGFEGLDHITGAGGADILQGGLGNDVFHYLADWGADLLEDFGGLDAIDFSGVSLALTFGIALAAITVTDGTNTLAVNGNIIERLLGGSGDDQFVFSVDGVTLAGGGVGTEIDGNGGRDVLDYQAFTATPVHVNLSAAPVTVGVVNLPAHSATGVETVLDLEILFGGQEDDILIGDGSDNLLRGGPGDDYLDGEAGDDSLDYSANTAASVTVNLETNTVTSTETGLDTFFNIENLTGSSFNDTLIGPDVGATFNITGSDAGNLDNTFFFAAIENLTGGNGDDDFVLTDSGQLSGDVTGGTGSDGLDYQGVVSQVSVTLGGPSPGGGFGGGATAIGGIFSQIDKINANSAVLTDTLTGANLSATWELDGTDRLIDVGTGNALEFSGFDSLTGGSDEDIFEFWFDTYSFQGDLDGGGGTNDALDYTNYTAQASVTLTDVASGTGSASGLSGTFAHVEIFHGSANSDTLAAPASDDSFNISASNAGNIDNSFHFTQVENLDAGDGADTLNFTSFSGPVTINLETRSATGLGGEFVNFENFSGSADLDDTLIGPNGGATFNITGLN